MNVGTIVSVVVNWILLAALLQLWDDDHKVLAVLLVFPFIGVAMGGAYLDFILRG